MNNRKFLEALNCAEVRTFITNEDQYIINYSRKSLLFNKEQAWMKKQEIRFIRCNHEKV